LYYSLSVSLWEKSLDQFESTVAFLGDDLGKTGHDLEGVSVVLDPTLRSWGSVCGNSKVNVMRFALHLKELMDEGRAVAGYEHTFDVSRQGVDELPDGYASTRR
jgi:hypothetical protein